MAFAAAATATYLLPFPFLTCNVFNARHYRFVFVSTQNMYSRKTTSNPLLCSQRKNLSSGLYYAEEVEEEEVLKGPHSFSLPDFSTDSNRVTLLTPLQQHARDAHSRLLVYVPGMDCTGRGIGSQLLHLTAAGYDVRCIYIPSSDRSSWKQLVTAIIPLLRTECTAKGVTHQITLVGESFGGSLALRLALAAPEIVSCLVLVNPATNFRRSSPLASFFASTQLLSMFPEALYKTLQDILLPLMMNRCRVSKVGNEEMLSPIDYVPSACAAWRLSLLNDDTGLSDSDISLNTVPTLLLCAAQDRVVSSMIECGRLQQLIRNAKRVILPHSGHTILLEDSVNLAMIMDAHIDSPPSSPVPSENSSSIMGLRIQKKDISVTDDRLDEFGQLFEPWRILTSPLVSGDHNLPCPKTQKERPLLFVGNHTMFGSYDTPLLLHELFLRGFRCRGLADPGHWAMGLGPVFERYGHVKATKFAAYRLLKEGQNVLLFPGGAREVFKRKGEAYQLFWKPRAEFVRMASRFQAIIIPFASLGGDDAYTILWDSDELLGSPIGPILKDLYERIGLKSDNLYPVTAIPGTNLPSFPALPSIQRVYFHFADPIDTSNYSGNLKDSEEYNALYLLVKERVERSINFLKDVRSNDPEHAVLHRVLQNAKELMPEFNRPKPGPTYHRLNMKK